MLLGELVDSGVETADLLSALQLGIDLGVQVGLVSLVARDNTSKLGHTRVELLALLLNDTGQLHDVSCLSWAAAWEASWDRPFLASSPMLAILESKAPMALSRSSRACDEHSSQIIWVIEGNSPNPHPTGANHLPGILHDMGIVGSDMCVGLLDLLVGGLCKSGKSALLGSHGILQVLCTLLLVLPYDLKQQEVMAPGNRDPSRPATSGENLPSPPIAHTEIN